MKFCCSIAGFINNNATPVRDEVEETPRKHSSSDSEDESKDEENMQSSGGSSVDNTDAEDGEIEEAPSGDESEEENEIILKSNKKQRRKIEANKIKWSSLPDNEREGIIEEVMHRLRAEMAGGSPLPSAEEQKNSGKGARPKDNRGADSQANDKRKRSDGKGKRKNNQSINKGLKRLKINDSETTIYKKAVPEKSNRFSSSSDEFINTSDEIEGERINDFITDCREEFENRRERSDYHPIPTFHGPEQERRPPPRCTLEEVRVDQMFVRPNTPGPGYSMLPNLIIS